MPTVAAEDASGVADAPISLPITAALTDLDGSETLSIEIDGVPSSYELSAGVRMEDGSWLLTAADLPGLAMVPVNPAGGASGDFSLQITVTSTDGTDTATASTTMDVSIEAPATALSGRIVDGYIAGATVFADSDNDGVLDVAEDLNNNSILDEGEDVDGDGTLDSAEAFTTSAADGSFTLVGGTGPLVMFGGIDVSTGHEFQGVMRAPEGSTVVTPLTTLISALIEATANDAVPLNVATAQAALAAAFGLLPGIDLTNFDPVAEIQDGTAGAAAVLGAAVQVQATITQVAAAVGGEGALESVLGAVTDAILDATGEVNLANAATLTEIVTAVVPAGTLLGVIEAVSEVVSAANASVDAALATPGGGVALLEAVAQSAQVALGATTEALADAGLNAANLETVVDDFTGPALDEAIEEAPVGDVDGGEVGTIGNDTLSGGAFDDVIDGLDGDDVISGNGGDDLLYGGAGVDRLDGGEGNDTLNGGAGNNDILIGGAGADILDGSDGFDFASYRTSTAGLRADLAGPATNTGDAVGDTYVSIERLEGSAFNDILRGDDNNNFLEGGAGADDLRGRGGFDMASYIFAASGVTASLANPAANTGDAAGDTYVEIEGLVGSAFADTLTGDGSGNALRGNDGADVLDGGLGIDMAEYTNSAVGVTADLGNAANNTGHAAGDTYISIENLRGSNNGADILRGNGGDNNLEGANGNFADTLDGAGGFDTASYSIALTGVTASLANPTANTGDAAGDVYISIEGLQGSNFNDVLTGDDNNNTLSGGNGSDTLNGGLGNDTLNGGDGNNDVLVGGAGADVNNGGNGNDFASYQTSAVALTVDLLTTSNNTGDAVGDTYVSIERLIGSAFNDTLSGDNNGNFLEGGQGADVLDGRGGGDYASYIFATGGVTANLASQAGITGEAAGDTYTSIENLAGSNFADTLIGDNNNNVLRGNDGADVLNGSGGTDWAEYIGAAAGVTADLGNSGNNTGYAAGDTYISIENLRGSNTAGDTLRGDGLQNFLEGGQGNFVDVLDGAGGNDFAAYGGATAAVTASLANPSINTGDAQGDVYFSIEGLQGSNFNDTLTGDGNNNFLIGGGGADVLDGGLGIDQAEYRFATTGITADLANSAANTGEAVGDTYISIENLRGSNNNDILRGDDNNNSLRGTGGADVLDGRGGIDTADYFMHTTTLVADLFAPGGNTGEAAGDTYISIENIRGGLVNDTLRGDNGANQLDGQGGNDTLVGRGGDDVLIGGAGADTVVYATGGGADTVNDFNHGDGDLIDLTGVAGVHELADVLALATQDGPNTVIDFGGGDTLTLLNVDKNTLVGGDFVFTPDPNQAPTAVTFDNATTEIDENSDVSGGITVADIVVTDDAFGTETLSLSGADAAFFEIVGNQLRYIGPSPDFEAKSSYSVTVNADDATVGGPVDAFETFTLNITNVSGNFVGDNDVNNIVGTTEEDTIQALGANDTLQGLAGNDTLDGGTGSDRAVYSDATGGITVNMAAGTVNGAGVGSDTLIAIEQITGSNHVDTYDATGYIGADLSPGTSARLNDFQGLAGNDTITGNGTTRISYVSATGGVTVDIAAGSATGDASVDTDSFTGVRSVRGSNFADTTFGSDNTAGAPEVFEGRGGDDFIDGRGGGDRVQYNFDATSAGIRVNMTNGVVVGDAAIGTDTLRSVENIRGTDFADVYVATGFGTGGVNIGNQGTSNEFEGEGGNDFITGNGSTRVSYLHALAGVTVDMSTTVAGSGTAFGTYAGDVAGVGVDSFTQVNAIRGSTFNDTLRGSNNGAGTTEFFEGFGGDDFIDGRGGFDVARYDNLVDEIAGPNGITVDMADGTVTGIDAAATAIFGNDTLRRVEGIRGSDVNDAYDATGFGVVGALNIGSNGTLNEFEGMAGNDSIIGNGNTRISYGSALAGVTVDLAAGTAQGVAAGDVAGVGTDTIVSGVNAVRGSGFNDVFRGTGANETFDGQGGNDRMVYSDATAFITVNMNSTNTVVGASVGTDTLQNVEFITGTTFGDSFTAAGVANTSFFEFQGGDGDDSYTGNGNTRVSYLDATTGVAVDLAVTVAQNTVGAGSDTLTGGINSLRGSNFNDQLSGTNNGTGTNEQFEGRGGNDQIDGRGGFDIAVYDIDGATTAGINVVASGVGLVNWTVTGDSTVGTDTLTAVEAIRGTDFADTFNAAGFNGSSINGTTFAEFEGMGGNDTITGNGNTRVTFGNATSGVVVDLTAGTATGDASVGSDTITGGVTRVRGSNLNDVIGGTSGNDILEGQGGNDTVSYLAATGGVTVNLGLTTLQNTGGAGSDTLSTFEWLIGSNFGDTLTGSGGDNIITGAGGDDNIIGNGGRDIAVFSGDFADYTVTGFTSVVDNVAGRDGSDTLNGIAILEFADRYVLNQDNSTGTLALNGLGFAPGKSFYGTTGDDTILTGTNSNLRLFDLGDGVSDAITLNGAGTYLANFLNVEFIIGTAGGNENVYLQNVASGVAINLLGGTGDALTLANGANIVTIGGIENVTGGTGDDQITVAGASSVTSTITGGLGADVMTGSGDNIETFRYASVTESSGASIDTIGNFTEGQDLIDFTVIDADTTGGGNEAFTFVANGTPGTNPGVVANSITWYQDGGNTIVQADVNGDTTADLTITLTGLKTLTASDFLL